MKLMIGKKKKKIYRMMFEAVIKQESTSKRRENRRATKEHQLLAQIYAEQEYNKQGEYQWTININ